MKLKLTPWFSVTQGPTLIGEYDYKYENGYEFRAYWSGAKWTIHDEVQPLFWGEDVLVDRSTDKWRGLAEDPAKAAP
jgi:hypothetical protein